MKLFEKIIAKFVKRVIDKSVTDVVSHSDAVPEVPEGNPITMPGGSSKKDVWKFVIQVLISILTALAAALGTTSCMGLHV